jgi:hypothetical protein
VVGGVRLHKHEVLSSRFVLALMVSLAATSAATVSAQWGWFRPTGPAYALDGVSRRATDHRCAPQEMVRYRSSALRTSSGVVAHPAFIARMPELERVVHEVSIAHYGRAPRRMLTVGAFVCRNIRGRDDRVSEHALGNALDVQGFELPAMRRADVAPAAMPRRLRRGFMVTVGAHWRARDEAGRYHGAFLRALVARLAHDDVFRVIYGPAHPGHTGHFHFDMSPFRWIHV